MATLTRSQTAARPAPAVVATTAPAVSHKFERSVSGSDKPVATVSADIDTYAWYATHNPKILSDLGFKMVPRAAEGAAGSSDTTLRFTEGGEVRDLPPLAPSIFGKPSQAQKRHSSPVRRTQGRRLGNAEKANVASFLAYAKAQNSTPAGLTARSAPTSAPGLRTASGAGPRGRREHRRSAGAHSSSRASGSVASSTRAEPMPPQDSAAMLALQKGAAKVASQMAQRYYSVKSFVDLRTESTAADAGHVGSFNPLQTIRDRAQSGFRSESAFMWSISANEFSHDLAWRQSAIARNSRHTSASARAVTATSLGPATANSLLTPDTSMSRAALPETPINITTRRSSSNLSVLSELTQASSFTDMHDRLHTSGPGLPYASPAAKDSQLIEKLKCKYEIPPSGGSSDNLMDSDFELLERPQPRRPTMSRNTSQVAGFAGGVHRRAQSDVGLAARGVRSATAENLTALTPLTTDTARANQLSATSLVAAPQLKADALSSGGASPGTSANTSLANASLPYINNLSTLKPVTPITAATNGSSYLEESSSDPFDEFTSLTKCAGTKRCSEVMAQHELEYTIAVFEAALRKGSVDLPKRPLPSRELRCSQYKEALKSDVLPRYLDYLSGMEKTAVVKLAEIEKEVGRPMDTLRVDSDRIISEVNTTLNKKLREAVARLDKSETACRTAYLYNYGYLLLEWTVIIVLRVIWLAVGALRCFKALLVFLWAALASFVA